MVGTIGQRNDKKREITRTKAQRPVEQGSGIRVISSLASESRAAALRTPLR